MSPLEVRVPDIGDFAEVPVIEIHVAVGDEVAVEDPLVTLESDKATMDVPAPAAGVVSELHVTIGERVSEGSLLLALEPAGAGAQAHHSPTESAVHAEPPPPAGELDADVVVIGAGPGGYTAAFRAADLGLRTILVEREERLGGVCLNVGCIPSKALLHAARVLAEAEEMAEHGLRFAAPEIDLEALLGWKEGVVGRLTDGLAGMARVRSVEVVRGQACFSGPRSLRVAERELRFGSCIIATGSEAVRLPFLPEDRRVMDSTAALSPASIPPRLLVIGGGIIGLEMATVYDALGSLVTVVELLGELIPGCDPDLVAPLRRRIEGRYEGIHTGVSVVSAEAGPDGVRVRLSSGAEDTYDAVLVAVGRRPATASLELAAAGVEVSEAGFVPVDAQQRTNVSGVYAVGDVTGLPLLAHKATHQGKVAAEVIAGVEGTSFDALTVPSVAYTDPEVAWMGLTETAARADGVAYEKAEFPWTASGRALSLARPQGVTKLLVEPGSRRVLGAGVVGVGAGELIAELVLALELGAVAEDVALAVHAHPTLSETVGLAAEVAEGTITDLPPAPRSR